MNLFTVEQLELIRRLKTTGITGQEIVQAFNQLEQVSISVMEQVDQEYVANSEDDLIRPDEIPVLEKINSQDAEKYTEPEDSEDIDEEVEMNIEEESRICQPASSNTTPVIVRPQPSKLLSPLLMPLNLSNLTNLNSFVGLTPLLQLNAAQQSPIADEKMRFSVQTVPLASTASDIVSIGGAAQVDDSQNAAGRPIRSQRTPMKEITTLDDPNELEEFMQQGEEGCISDMRNFINTYSLRQTTVAMMTGVSQPYISKLLNGNHRELSLRCRKNIYCWYLNCRRHPSKLSAFIADPSTRLETNGDGELIPQRRERYVFRPALIKMLEEYFIRTPFPNLARRTEIANACNAMLKKEKKGVPLMPKEVVSAQVVANWFANKRKEIRRKSGEKKSTDGPEGLSPNLSVSPSGGEHFKENESRSNSIDTPPSTSSFDVLSSPSPPLDMLSIVSRLGLPIPFKLPGNSPVVSTPTGLLPALPMSQFEPALGSPVVVSTSAPLLQAALLQQNPLGSPTTNPSPADLRFAQLAQQILQQQLQMSQVGEFSGLEGQKLENSDVGNLLNSFNPAMLPLTQMPSIMCQNTM